ncbi:hypothetical protein ACFLZR_01080 [Candidatus Neomarinimicrobiota bacterium]
MMAIMGGSLFAQGQDLRFTIATNPYKPFLGIVSIEIEIGLTDHFSAHTFYEKKYADIIDHPDNVVKFGSRYYFYHQNGYQSKTFLGFNIANATSGRSFGGDGISLGGELGYKYLSKHKLAIFPTLIGHYQLDEKTFLPGFEVTFGKQYEYSTSD